MKKYGKYEKRPEGVAQKQPKVKNLLLQTYFTSLLCLVLCVSMFFGTSYAWFTSEVQNTGNEIYIGTLDVGLYKQENSSRVDLASSDSNTAKLFDGNIRWEPGYTTLETIHVVNEGDLAFRYVLSFTDGKVTSSDDQLILKELAKNFVVYVHAGDYTTEDPEPKSFADITESKYWVPVKMGEKDATLADILDKEIPVISGNMEDVRDSANMSVPVQAGPSDSKKSEDTYIIALHMKEDTESNDIMGHRISLNVKLTAYQRTHEEDAFGSTYDLQAQVTNLGPMEISYTTWIGQPAQSMQLDTAYQFQPVESSAEAKTVPYRKYVADFVVWADKDVPANSIALAGYYDAWCQLNDDNWIALTSPDAIPAGKQIRLVESMGNQFAVTYEMLCEYGNDGIGFLCGAADLNDSNSGTTLTVELRLYEVENDGSGNVETGDYITVGSYEYTFK